MAMRRRAVSAESPTGAVQTAATGGASGAVATAPKLAHPQRDQEARQGFDWVSSVPIRSVRVVLAGQTMSPIEFHTFGIPQLDAVVDVPEGWTAERAVRETLAVLRALQQECFEGELVRHMENAMNAGKRAHEVHAGMQRVSGG